MAYSEQRGYLFFFIYFSQENLIKNEERETMGYRKRGGRGGGIENANPAIPLPHSPLSPVSYPLMQNIELKELIRMCAEIGNCGA